MVSFNQVIRFVVGFCFVLCGIFVCLFVHIIWRIELNHIVNAAAACVCACLFIHWTLPRSSLILFFFFIASNGRINFVSECASVCAPHVWRPSVQTHAYVQYILTYVHIYCELLVYGLRYIFKCLSFVSNFSGKKRSESERIVCEGPKKICTTCELIELKTNDQLYMVC